jgi:hypothetical protein
MELIVEDTSDVRLDNVKTRDVCDNWIYTKLTIHPYFYGAVAAFDLTVPDGCPYSDEDDPHPLLWQLTPRGVLIKSVSNGSMRDCMASNKCIDVEYSRYKELWSP